MRLLNETTRRANASSFRVHCEQGFARKVASAGRRRRVAGKLASFARGSLAHRLMAAGLMFTEALNFAQSTSDPLDAEDRQDA